MTRNHKPTDQKLPWMKWYPADVLGDHKLRLCSAAARGVWYDMLWMMYLSDRRGYLQKNGKPYPDQQICRITGIMPDELQAARVELLEHEVPSVEDGTGIWYNRRMVRDEALRSKGRAAGLRGGGNPALNSDKSELENQSLDTRILDTRATIKDTYKPTYKGNLYRSEASKQAFENSISKLADEKHEQLARQWFEDQILNGEKFSRARADLIVADILRIPVTDRDRALQASIKGAWKAVHLPKFEDEPGSNNKASHPKTGLLAKTNKPWEGGLHG